MWIVWWLLQAIVVEWKNGLFLRDVKCHRQRSHAYSTVKIHIANMESWKSICTMNLCKIVTNCIKLLYIYYTNYHTLYNENQCFNWLLSLQTKIFITCSFVIILSWNDSLKNQLWIHPFDILLLITYQYYRYNCIICILNFEIFENIRFEFVGSKNPISILSQK